MQSKEDLEEWYTVSDPWLYKQTIDDEIRKNLILDVLPLKYFRALDIGCGEGFVATDLPAIEIHGIEISDNAAQRLPWNVRRVFSPEGMYDLVITTGTLYQQYNHKEINDWIVTSACRHVLVAGIKDWLLPYSYGKVLIEKQFNYRQYTQQIVLYEVSA
jgi:protein-L-isoaspartate O-methyltransferase